MTMWCQIWGTAPSRNLSKGQRREERSPAQGEPSLRGGGRGAAAAASPPNRTRRRRPKASASRMLPIWMSLEVVVAGLSLRVCAHQPKRQHNAEVGSGTANVRRLAKAVHCQSTWDKPGTTSARQSAQTVGGTARVASVDMPPTRRPERGPEACAQRPATERPAAESSATPRRGQPRSPAGCGWRARC